MITLKFKVFLMLLAVFGLYFCLEYGIQRYAVYPIFLLLDGEMASNRLMRCKDALELEAEHAALVAQSLGRMDSLKEMGQQNQQVCRSLSNVFGSGQADFALIFDGERNLAWWDIAKEYAVDAGQRQHLVDGLITAYKQILISSPGSNQAGILDVGLWPVVAATAPVTNWGDSTDYQGTIFLGRFITKVFSDEMSLRIGQDFRVRPIREGELTAADKEAMKHISSGKGVWINEIGDNLLQVYSTVNDAAGEPVLLIRTHVTKVFAAKGRHVMVGTLIIIFGGGFGAVYILVTLIEFVIISPIRKLKKQFVGVGAEGNAPVKIKVRRYDEIGGLAREFNQMVERLDEARKKLLEKSYLSGMAEMSSAVLHNARNSLNPVLSYIDRMHQQLKGLPIEKVQIAQDELERENISAQRRDDLVQFVKLANKSFVEAWGQTQGILDELLEQVEQMEEMLAGQKTMWDIERPLENVQVGVLLQDAVNLIPSQLRGQIFIDIDESLDRLPAITTHRVVFLQVLQNLLINAAESLCDSKPLYPRIYVKGAVETPDTGQMLHLQISDNGRGIETDRLQKIFERGNSSKIKGLTGIGLHWCANAITAMKGSVRVESKGRNQGACFHITLPILEKSEAVLI